MRKELLKKLPPYMVPNYFISLEELPLNSNGKLDRTKLPEPFYSEVETTFDVSDLSESEILLVEQLNELFGMKVTNLEDSFISLGGNSLQAIRLSNSLYKLTNKSISSREILTATTIKMLALLIENVSSDNKQATTGNSNIMSPSEKRMYILFSQNPNSVLYNEQTILKFNTRIDCLKMKQAIESVADKYEILRTSFIFQNGMYQRNIGTKAGFEFIEETFDANFENLLGHSI